MNTLKPDWSQQKPSVADALRMCDDLRIAKVEINAQAVTTLLDSLQESHSNGGEQFAAVQIGPDPAFDWFASRNRLLEFDILPRLLQRQEMKAFLPNLLAELPAGRALSEAECAMCSSYGFRFESTFLFDGTLANTLYSGGAYHLAQGDGRAEKQLAISFCDALFEQRYAEVAYFVTFDAWTPWFKGVAWDWTAVLWDRRKRTLFILAVTDTD